MWCHTNHDYNLILNCFPSVQFDQIKQVVSAGVKDISERLVPCVARQASLPCIGVCGLSFTALLLVAATDAREHLHYFDGLVNYA